MIQAVIRPVIKLSYIGILLSFLSACQPSSKDTQVESANNDVATQSQKVTPALQSKTVPVKLQQASMCDESGCTEYEFQTVQTNQKWIDDYFLNRLKKTNPLPFEKSNPAQTTNQNQSDMQQQRAQASKTSNVVRYVGQNDRLATFELSSSIYNAGAAHGMYQNEYVNFDLSTQKRISLQDLIVAGSESKIIDALFLANSNWLSDHSIQREKLTLSDNFYYGTQGIVFVYPVYELASYAEGMSELVLPYSEVSKLIKAKYLPSLPVYQ